MTGGGGEVTGFAADVHVPETMKVGVADSRDEVRRAVRRLLAGGADFIKVIATGAVLAPGTTPGASEYSEDEIRAAVEEAAMYGTVVAAHAHGAEGIKRATRAGVRSIEHGSFADDEALALMAERGTYLVADVWAGDWMDRGGQEERVARSDDEENHRHHRDPAGRISSRSQAWREDWFWHRLRHLPARHEHSPAAQAS